MTKKVKALSVLGVIAILGVGIFGGYKKQLETQATIKVQELVQQVCNLGQITRIEYQVEDLITLENQSGKWVNTQLMNLTYNQELMQDWVSNLHTLETKEVIKNVQDKSIYGINDASITITLHDGENNKETIKLGDIIESEDSMYIQGESEDVLYVVSYESAKSLLVRPNNFVDCTEVLQIPELQSVKVDYKNETMSMMKEDVWYLKDYYAMPVILKEDSFAKFLETIQKMKISHYIGTYEDLDAYGLDSPRLTLTLNDKIKIAFGSQSGKNIYISVNDGHDVYTIDQEVYAAFTGFKPFNAMDRQVIWLSSDEVQEVTLVNPQGNYLLSFKDMITATEEEQKKQEENTETITDSETAADTETIVEDIPQDPAGATEDSKQEENKEIQAEIIAATLNEKSLTKVEAEEWLNKIKESLWIEALLQNPSIEQKEERKAEATICFKLKDGSERVTELIPYDINYYILRYNGTIEFAVSKDKVTKLFNEVTHFVKK